MENNNKNFIEALEIKTKELKNCQIKNNIDSCMQCDKIIGCKVRQDYVIAVHQSMNKGTGGGFEF